MSEIKIGHNCLADVIVSGDPKKCHYCDHIVESNDEYMKHVTDNHWKDFIKECLNLDI